MDLRLDHPVARIRPVDDRGDDVEWHLDGAGMLVAYRQLARDDVTVGHEHDGGARRLIEDRRGDPAVRDARGAVEAIRDAVACRYPIAATSETKLESRRIRRRAAEAAAVLGKGEIDVLRSGHGAEGYAPEPPGVATPR
jgi:hypothetical protein